jgi:glutamate dehydrogenase (NADP+)
LKLEKRDRLKNYKSFDINGDYHDDADPWNLCGYEVAAPSATQNEIDEENASQIKEADAAYVLEAANMPLSASATEFCIENNITVLPAKAVNAGGVAVSGIERTQNALMQQWPAEKVDQKLKDIMRNIYKTCVDHAPTDKQYDRFIHGANIAGFRKVADAIIAQGGLN